MKVDIMTYRKAFTQKPSGQQAGYMQSRFKNESLTLEEIADLLKNGNSIKPAHLKGSKSSDWVSQQLFALDFDTGISIDKVLERCDALEISAAFSHTSFSHTEKVNKFRVYFATSEKIEDIRLRNLIQFTLIRCFEDCDQKTKDPTRIFFGGKNCKGHGILHKDFSARLEPFTLINSYIAELRSTKRPGRALQQYCEEVAVNLVDNYPSIFVHTSDEGVGPITEILDEKSGKVPQELLYYNRSCGDLPKNGLFYEKSDSNVDIEPKKDDLISYNGNIKFAVDFSIKEDEVASLSTKKKVRYKVTNEKIGPDSKKLIRGFDFTELESKCPLYKGFVDGEYWAYHEEIFHLATNLSNVEGAQARLIKALEYNHYDKTRENKLNTIYFASKQNYLPSRCEGNCRLKDECNNNTKNILTFMDLKKRAIRRLDNCKVQTLEKAEEMLEEMYYQVMSAQDRDVHVLKVGTGLGKTKMFTDETDLEGCCVAVCDHQLLNEVVERSKVQEKFHMGELVGLPTAQKEAYEYYLSIGDSKSATGVLLSYCKDLEDKLEEEYDEKSFNDLFNIKKYLNNRKDIQETDLPIFCTHHRAFTLKNENIHTYIFDEDFLKTALTTTVVFSKEDIAQLVSIADEVDATSVYSALTSLERLMDRAETYKGVTQLVRCLSRNKKDINKVYKYLKSNNIKIKVNLRDILRVDNIIFDNKFFHGIIKNSLPAGKIIVLSATVDKDIYEELIKDREVNFYEIDNIVQKGTVIHHYCGASRTYMKNQKSIDNLINKIKTESPSISNLITFKNKVSDFKEAGFNARTHLGACSGLDSMKGQDLIVAGTYHTNEVYYKLLATLISRKALGSVNIEYKRVERNGFEFYMSTYEDDSLIQKIQMHLIEAELVQAVGRARTLREDCEVHVYSCLPIKNCVLYEEIEGKSARSAYLDNIDIAL